ncbi:MAG: signal peptide peptidase SppA [Myxococcales bacterium]|nr:signal peptide peptidase SppA [Myxococcales bacterium]
MTRLLGVLALLVTLATAAPAAAQVPLGGEAPTLGVRLPSPALVGNGNASALEISPGALGTLRAWSLQYHHTEIRSDGRIAGTGDALFAALPLPYTPLVFGAGFQWLRPPDGIGYSDYVKISLGFAANLGALSLGAVYHTFISDDSPAIDSIDTLDVGFVLRPTQWIGAAFALRNLTTPLYAGLPLQREYDVELAARPTLTQGLEIGLGVKIGERRGDVDPHLRLRFEPTAGLTIEAYGELVRRDFYRDGDKVNDLRVSFALGFSLERIGVAASAFLGRGLRTASRGALRDSGPRAVFQGMGATLTLSGVNRKPLFETGRHLIKMRLRGAVNASRMLRIIAVLRRVKRRRDIAGVFLEIDGFGGGWARTQELRTLLMALRGAGKKVYAYLRAPGVGDYYLASVADKIWLDPDGGIAMAGLAIEQSYFKGLLDLVGAGAHFVKIGEYKSAPETFTRKGASPAAARVRRALLDDIFNQLLFDLGKARNKSKAEMRAIIDKGPFTAPRALKNGLVDALASPDQIGRLVTKTARAGLTSPRTLFRASRRWPRGSALAVIAIEGDIVRGKSQTIPLIGRRVVGDETISKAARWARGNSRIRGVVLRVNSPGGSALASARMWREIRLLAKTKPVIVSFGNIAASGGYYAAAAASRILAMPSTITGSIGIFAGKYELRGLKKKLGITVETEARGKNALINSTNRPYTAAERKFLQDRIKYYYDRFISAVAEGRKVDKKVIDKVARGRVWTGNQAKRVKLVDAYGGLSDALSELKKKLRIPESRDIPVYVLPRPRRTLLGRLLGVVGVKSETKKLEALLPKALESTLRSLPPALLKARDNEPMMRLPFDVRFK